MKNATRTALLALLVLPGCALFPRNRGEWTVAFAIVGIVVVAAVVFAVVSMRRDKDDR